MRYLKRIDPDLVRCTFVYSKFYSEMRNFYSSTQINKALAREFENINVFHTTVLSRGLRESLKEEPEKFKQYLFYIFHRDLNTADSLSYDKRHSRSLGLFNFASYLQNKVSFFFFFFFFYFLFYFFFIYLFIFFFEN